MRKLTAILFFLVIWTVTFGQLPFLSNDLSESKKLLPDKIKTIRQYKGNLLLNIREYDTLKNLTFSHSKQYIGEHWNGKFLTIITGNLYDDSGILIKSYLFHSNAGLSISYYEYDSLGNNTKVFVRNNHYEYDDSLINTNPYSYIEGITNISELINHPKINEIEKVAQKYLELEQTYDSVRNMLTKLSFNEIGDTSGYQRYQYDANKNNVYISNEWSKENRWEYYFEYEKEYSFFKEDEKTGTKPKKILQSVRVNFDWRENRKRISNITLFKYNNRDRLIEEITYRQGEFEHKYVYEYDESDQVTMRTTYIHDSNKIANIERYSYNDEGDVVKEINEDFRSKEKEKNRYRYQYEYYIAQ